MRYQVFQINKVGKGKAAFWFSQNAAFTNGFLDAISFL
jgi:hypothetical protein